MLILFCPESLLLHLPCKNNKDCIIWNYHFVCFLYVCVWNCVTHTERKT